VRADLTWSSWAAAADENTTRFRERTAVIDGDLDLTWDELGQIAGEIADGLIARGLAPGERVAIWMPNSWAWIACLLGTLWAGGVIVPINTRLRGFETRQIMDSAQPRFFFVVNRFLGDDYPSLLQAAGGTRAAMLTVSIEDQGGDDLAALRRDGGRVGGAERRVRIAAQRPEEACALMHTAGTTGLAKGVLLTNGRLLRAFSYMGEQLGLTPEDRFMVIPPFSHTYGLGLGLLSSQLYGCAIVPVPVFDAGDVLRDVQRHRVTVLPGPPTMFVSLLEHPDRATFDLRSLRAGTTGATNIPVELVHRVRRELGMTRLLTAYGLTESTGLVSMCHPEDDADHVATTSGRPVDGMEVRIAGAQQSSVLPDDRVGEIQVRGYAVMDGYISGASPDEAITPDGWLRTGDLGRLTQDGYVQILDRLKDIVIVGGFNVAPAEVENVLLLHPAVLDCAVVGVPDARLGEVPYAFVVWRPDYPPVTDVELAAFCTDRVAKFKVPRQFATLEAVPRNAVGKVQKELLKEQAARLQV
jgi:acyl-CoA synthetase (AMP-forming)/AMP-acid ligase II